MFNLGAVIRRGPRAGCGQGILSGGLSPDLLGGRVLCLGLGAPTLGGRKYASLGFVPAVQELPQRCVLRFHNSGLLDRGQVLRVHVCLLVYTCRYYMKL